MDGLKESVALFSEAGSSAKDVLELVLCNQSATAPAGREVRGP